MDNRPIGVFDSGLGGLTAVKELQRLLPGEDIVYFGDTARVPYGSRSRETILKYARQDVRFLLGFGIKAVLVACGTVSAAALPELTEEFSVPMAGIILPAVRRAAVATRTGRVGLIATQASVRARGFERAMRSVRPEVTLYSDACPLLVPLAENGRVGRDDPVTRLVLEESLAPMRGRDVDTLILGCTHYPLLAEAIGAALPGVTLVDSGAEAAHFISAAREWDRAAPDREGRTRYYVSDNAEGFARISGLFLGRPIGHSVGLVDIETIL
ncbi:MAG: glutamate racemase [Oscillospiraceae bacterium]|nr:glutamate racemase [Oscillospiraceae bacterium]